MNDVQEKILEILIDLGKVLDAHQITYYIAYGTALGAVREKGFIPWDDDADVCIFRKDRGAFLEAVKDLDPEKYYIQHPDVGDYVYNFFRVKMNGTTYIEKTAAHLDIHHGVFVDIFIMNDVPDGIVRRFAYQSLEVILGKTRAVFLKAKSRRMRDFVLFSRRLCEKTMDVLSGNTGMSELVSARFGYFKTTTLPRSVVGTPIMASFEGHMMPIPEKYDVYLSITYGDDYMTPPDETKRDRGLILISDMNKDYTEYTNSKR